jgi:hypothetical protein
VYSPIERFPYHSCNTFDIRQHFVSPESQQPFACKRLRSSRVVGCVFAMLSTIDFNDHARLDAGKVGNVVADLVLSAESQAINLTHAQMAPQELFRVGQFAAQLSGKVLLCW